MVRKLFALGLSVLMLICCSFSVFALSPVTEDGTRNLNSFEPASLEKGVSLAAAQDSYVYNRNVYMEDYSPLFSLSGGNLTSYYTVGPSSDIDYVTIKIYRETSPSATGRTLIASKVVYTGTSSTLFFRDKPIVAGANYRVHVIPNKITTANPATVVVSLVSW